METFRHLSELVGSTRVVWRFDPLILTDTLTVERLLDRVSSVAAQLRGLTDRLVISVADISEYKKVQNKLQRQGVRYRTCTPDVMAEIAQRLQALNRDWKLTIASCAEGIDLEIYGIAHNRCIDDELMIQAFPNDRELMKFLGYEPNLFSGSCRPRLKDRGQRKECGCILSKDIGMYDTCQHLYTYCYANASCSVVGANRLRHHEGSDAIVS